MSTAPFMPLYIGDYHADTTHLSTQEHGAYLLLLMAMWRAAGKLPSDPAKLARLAKCTAEEWAHLAPEIMSFFTRRGGVIVHKRLSAELQKYQNKIVRAQKAGKASGLKRSSKIKDECPPQVATQSNQPEPEPEPYTPIVPKGTNPLFDEPNSDAVEPATMGDKPEPQSSPDKSKKTDTPIQVAAAVRDAIWAAAPDAGRKRSSKREIDQAIVAALRDKQSLEDVRAGMLLLLADPEITKEGGRYCPALHRLIRNGRWAGFLPPSGGCEPTRDKPQDPWPFRLRMWFGPSRFWNETDWGPRPGQDGCKASPEAISKAQDDASRMIAA